MRNNTQELVQVIRKDFTSLWTKCYVSQRQQNSCAFYFDLDRYTIEVLKEHKKEKEKYERLYNFNAKVLMKVELREKFWGNMESSERSGKDFKTRGGALLQHEKTRTNNRKLRY